MNIKIILFFFLMHKNLIYAGKINEEKNFDEIFGQRWDEKAEENGENGNDQNGINGQTDDQNVTKNNQILNENLEMKDEEKSEEMSTNDGDELEQLPENSGQINYFSSENGKKKREIVEKFAKIKEKIKQMGKKYLEKEWKKIERKIAKKLGTNQQKIYEWKREFGMIKKIYYSEEEKFKILKRFDQIYGKINEKLNEKLDGKRKKCQKIIAKHLGISFISIYKWKKQLGNSVKNQKIDEQRNEIVEKYFKIKNEFMQIGKHSRKEWKEFRAKIKQIFGVYYRTIERWTKKISINQNISKERKMLTIAEKMEAIKQYYQIKKQNPKFNEVKIAEILNIPRSSLRKYKAEFELL